MIEDHNTKIGEAINIESNKSTFRMYHRRHFNDDCCINFLIWQTMKKMVGDTSLYWISYHGQLFQRYWPNSAQRRQFLTWRWFRQVLVFVHLWITFCLLYYLLAQKVSRRSWHQNPKFRIYLCRYLLREDFFQIWGDHLRSSWTVPHQYPTKTWYLQTWSYKTWIYR